jgi:NTE family protein
MVISKSKELGKDTAFYRMPFSSDVPTNQRALVLQGGGALGAYEAGAYSILYESVSKRIGDNENIFDIIAGTSIGAMNAAVIVSHVIENRRQHPSWTTLKCWEGSAETLEQFWMDNEEGLSSTPDISEWWDEAKKPTRMFTASSEAMRRYYSVKAYLFKYGTPNVCLLPRLQCGLKFADPDNTALGLVSDSTPLQETIEQFSKHQKNGNNEDLRIATSWHERQPRLLVTSVDVAEGKTVAFDSYHKEAEDDPKNSQYDGDGITISHVMASGTLPLFYKLREIPTKGGRKFCDGGILSNTPFRDLLQAHSDYWKGVVGENQDKIPDLDVYIINVHPGKHDKFSTDDCDLVKERIDDITYSDRNSHYDEMVSDLVTDYTDLIDKLKELAKSHFRNKDESDLFLNEFENFLETTQAKSKGPSNEHRKYKDLLKGRFRLTNVTRIEHESYEDSIPGKGADFTSETIKTLIEKGKQDARRVLKLQ